MAPRVDVIVPCYRYGHYLDQCVGSILSQADVELRVLVIDDASPDNSAEVARALAARDNRVSFVGHTANKGHIATFNEGIEWAGGDCLLLLSADDYLVPGALARAARLLAEQPDVGFVFGRVLDLHEDGSILRIHPLGQTPLPSTQIMSSDAFFRLNGAKNIVPTPTVVVRTSLQKRVGGYRPELPHSGDMEMWLRLAAHSAVGFIDDDQAVYRRHDTNMSLGYYVESRLPDLRQRRKAIEFFLRENAALLLDKPDIRNILFEDLSKQAIRLAGNAFADNNRDATEAISRFAIEVFPPVWRSWPWAKLTCKRAMGPRNWQALRSAFYGLARQRS